MKSRFMKRMLSFILATVLLMGNVMPVMAEGSVSGNEVAETVVEETVVEESAVSEEPVSESEVNIEEESSEVSTTETTEETSSVESTTEESTEEQTTEVTTEVTTEELTEDSVSENEIPEDELSVSANEIIDEEVPLAGALPVTLEPVTVNGITITVSGPASAFAEGTTVSAVEVEPAEVVIEAAEESEQAEVKRYKAFDINLVCNGEVVQPLNGEEITVNFEGDLLIPDTDSEEDVVVYHVDDNDEITKMEAEVATVETEDAAEVETIEMTTTHFSTYVVMVTDVIESRKVVFEHYLVKNGDYEKATPLYVPSTVTVKQDEEINMQGLPLKGGNSYALERVIVREEGKPDVVYNNDKNSDEVTTIELKSRENTVRIYYSAVSEEIKFEDNLKFYDYYVDSYETKLVQDVIIPQRDGWSEIGRKFTYGGVEYGNQGENTVYQLDGNRIVKQVWYNYYPWYEQGVVIERLPDGAELLNVRKNNKTYNKLIYRESVGLVTENYREQSAWYNYNAGINAWAKDHVDSNTQAFLAMGLSKEGIYNETDMSTSGSATQVNGYFGNKVTKNANGKQITLDINVNNTHGEKVSQGENAIVPGIITGLTGEGYTKLVMGTTSDGREIVEPGYFSDIENDKYKVIFEDYGLAFNRTGDTYDLNYAYKQGTNYRTYSHDGMDGNGKGYNTQFLPLSNETPMGGRNKFQPYGDFSGSKNFYFGMRYDFTFTLGDYLGDLEYEFYGDDDLWVFVDGKRVLDLGGMHSSYPGTYRNQTESNKVDLWKAVFGLDRDKNKDDVIDDNWWVNNTYYSIDKIKEHTVTVLFLERGAYDSTCGMRFVMPNVEEKPPVVSKIPKTDVTLNKQNSKTFEPIEGVEFTLYTECIDGQLKSPKYTRATGSDGNVTFEDLKADEYYIKETKYDVTQYQENSKIYKVVVSPDLGGKTVSAKVYDGLEELKNNVVYNTPISNIDLEFVKVDSEDSTIILPNAEFELTSTTNVAFKKTATSDENGKILFEDIDAGVYTLKETKAPEGYTLPSEETLTITVEVKDGELGYTVSGNESNVWLQYGKAGEKHLLKNSKTVDITIRKDWQDKDGNPLATDEMEESVTVELFRKVENNDLTKESVQKNIILSAENEWTVTIEDLDSCGKDGVWTYSIEETDVKGFEAIYTEETEETTPDNIVLVVTNKEVVGSLKITKTVNRVDSEHGAAAFIFKITCADGNILYRTITFEGDIDKDTTKSVVVADLPVGECTVEELTALRYECKSDVLQTKAIEAKKTTEYSFRNEKDYDKNYSHTDVVVNKVVFNEDGSVTMTQEKSSTSDVVTE